MMKRLSALLMALVLCFSLFAASVKPSMDGRAVVADIGELPIGLFAKSAAFLPGDTVVVTNPATHISIEVMIFGGFDSSEGIAIVLSPEAARELYITKGSNVIVQVTKKTDAWSENTILSKTVESYTPEDDPDVNQEMMIDDIPEPVFDTPGVMVEDVVFYVEEPILPPEEFVEEPVVEELPVEEIPVIEELPAEEDTAIEDLPVEEEIPVEEEPVAVEPEMERAPLISRDNRVSEFESEETDLEEPVAEEKWALIPEETEFVGAMDDQEEPAAEESDIEEPVIEPETEAVIVPDEISEPEETAGDEEVPETEDEIVPEELSEPEEETEPEEDFIVETEVILIPTEFNPPEPVFAVDIEPETENEPELEPVIIPEEEPELDDEEDDGMLDDENDPVVIVMDDEDSIPELPEITVVSQSELPKGYYVQILTASRMTTVEDVRDLYGRNYPMQYAESARGGIQVLIGPLTADEYAIIQTRFRSYGYKDCFVRNIK